MNTLSRKQVGAGSRERGAGHERLSEAWRSTRHFRPVLGITVGLIVIFGLTQNVFLSTENLRNLLTAVAPLCVISVGSTFIVLTGGIDLSVGATAALAGVCLAKLLEAGCPSGLAILAAVLLGVLVGAAINGVLIGRVGLSFFVVTLASMTALTGAVNLWSDSESFFITSPVVLDMGTKDLLGVPISIWIAVLLTGAMLWCQARTYFGRDVYAVGGSVTAARLSGINTTRTIIVVYAIAGGCAALGGILSAARVGAATPQVEGTLALEAAAAILLGGTSLMGGLGGVGGTIFGVLFLGILQNGLSIAGVQSFWQQVLTGVILVLAVLGDRVEFRRLRRSWGANRGEGEGAAGAAVSGDP